MDGLTGGYHLLPLMDQNYRRLDNRANGDFVDGLVQVDSSATKLGVTEDAVAVALLVFRVELYIMVCDAISALLGSLLCIARCLSMRALILCAVDAALHSYILGNTKSQRNRPST